MSAVELDDLDVPALVFERAGLRVVSASAALQRLVGAPLDGRNVAALLAPCLGGDAERFWRDLPADLAVAELCRLAGGAPAPLLALILPISPAQARVILCPAELAGALGRAQAFAAVARLAAGLAHDLNNALETIYGAVSLLQLQPLAGGAQRYVELIDHSAEEIAAALRSLVSLNMTEPFERREFDLTSLARRVIERLGPRRGPGIELELRLPAEPIPMAGDPLALQGAIESLWHNALDALGSAGRVTLRVERTAEPRATVIEVRDDGPGWAAATAPEPLGSGKAKQRRAGLGLAIAAQVARLHGGTLVLAAAEGGGASAQLRLPSSG
jgi:signal transduction histidine kinase